MFKIQSKNTSNVVRTQTYGLKFADVKVDLDERILADERVKRLFKSKQSGKYALNTKELMDELEDLMQTRKYRQFDTGEFLKNVQKRSTEWQQELIAKRSRATSIKMNVFRTQRSLQEQIKNVKGYILNAYSVEIGRKHSAISAKREFVDHLLEPLQRILYRMETVLQLADILITDLDQGGRGIYNVNEALKIDYGKV